MLIFSQLMRFAMEGWDRTSYFSWRSTLRALAVKAAGGGGSGCCGAASSPGGEGLAVQHPTTPLRARSVGTTAVRLIPH